MRGKTHRKGTAAYNKEWDNLRHQKVWQNHTVREWSDVAREARDSGKDVHFGYLFGLMVEKNSELREMDPNDVRIKYKYRVVFRGNDVRDQNFDVALFQDMGSAASTMDASRSCDLYGCMEDFTTEQADAEQAYIQAKFPPGVAPTWVCLPEDEWLPEWKAKGMRKPVVLLEKALYGHPHAGAHWDNHADELLRKQGFNPIGDNWPSCYFHPEHKTMMVRYVDDFKISGPAKGIAKSWDLIRKVITIGEPEPSGLFLGCIHKDIEVTLPDGTKARGKEYDSEALLRDCVSLYKELSLGITGHEPKIQHVDTPSILEDVKNNCPAALPAGTGDAIECPYCKFTFPKDSFQRIDFAKESLKEEWWTAHREKVKKAKQDAKDTTNDEPSLLCEDCGNVSLQRVHCAAAANTTKTKPRDIEYQGGAQGSLGPIASRILMKILYAAR